MTNKDIDFFQNVINDILRYITRAEIKNETDEQRANNQRALFRVFTNTADAVKKEALQLNISNLEFWTDKELKDMPYLKELKYRITKNGIHQFRYRRDGFDEAFSSKDFNVAKQKAREFITSLKNQLNKVNVKNVPTLDNVAQLWLENKKNHVVNSTWRVYKSVYDNHIAPVFGKRRIKDILPMDLQPFFNKLAGSLGKTCENSKIILNGVFDYAVANRFCPVSPLGAVIVDRHVRKPGRALTNEEIEKFKGKMLTLGAYGTAYLIILNSGIRGAELQDMQFDWERGTFTVNNAKLKKTQRLKRENLKRTVPIFPGLYELRERIERNDWRYTAGYIADYLNKTWKTSTVKDLRHTFISKARESGVENELVNLWTGHLPGANVTANVYTHFSLDYQLEEARKVKI